MSKFFYRDRPAFGIEVSQTGLRAMAIDADLNVLAYGSIEVDPARLDESIKNNPEFLTKTIQSLLKDRLNGHLHGNHVMLSAPTSKTFTRSLSLPASAGKNMLDAIKLEAEQYIPVQIEDLSIDYQVIDRNDGNLDVLMSAIPKKIASIMAEAATSAGLTPILIEPSVNSIARLVKEVEHGTLPTILVDISASISDLAVLDKAIRVTGGASIGGNTFTLAIAKELKMTLEEAHHLKTHEGLNKGPHQTKVRAALAPHLDMLLSEIRKTIRYYNERLGHTSKLEQIVIVGAGSFMPGLGDYLTDALTMPARVANPWHALHFGKLAPPPKQMRPRYLTSVGMAMCNPKEIWK